MHQATLNCKLQNAVCASRGMASILSLTDDCLFKIVSYIDHPGSFHSFILTCGRFSQVTRKANSILHTNLLRAKAEFFIKSYIVYDIGETANECDKFDKLQNFLHESAQLVAAKEVLTYDRDDDHRNGPFTISEIGSKNPRKFTDKCFEVLGHVLQRHLTRIWHDEIAKAASA